MPERVSSLVADLRAMHRPRVNNVHAATRHSGGKRTLFSGCSCGWAGSVRIEDDYDASVPMPCPTIQRLDRFEEESDA